MFMRVRGNGLEPLRFLLVLVTTSLGWVVIGVGLLVGGLIWGMNSHQVSYVQGGHDHYQAFLTQDNGYIIFQQVNTDNYYVMHIPDYSPAIDTATILDDMHSAGDFSFIASTDSMRVGAYVESTGQHIDTGHPIEKVAFYGASHLNSLTYTNADYSGDPTGKTINYWLYAGILMLAGVLCAGNGLLFFARGKQRRKEAAAAERARLESMPSPFARELGATASAEAYQGAEQYSQPYNNPYRGPQE